VWVAGKGGMEVVFLFANGKVNLFSFFFANWKVNLVLLTFCWSGILSDMGLG
jgi:hypothetical protein